MKRQSNPIQSNPIQSNPILTVIAAAFLLAACSSGSSSHNHRPHSQVQHHTQSSGSASATSNQVIVRDENKPLSDTAGYYIAGEKAQGKEQLYQGKITLSDKPLETVLINGQNIPLLPPAQPHGAFHRWDKQAKGDGWAGYIGVHLQHARYGYLEKSFDSNNHKAYSFAQGKVSASLPDTVKDLTYRGKGIVLWKKKHSDAVSEFTVNFNKKSVLGTLHWSDGAKNETVNLSADIKGSHFSSKPTDGVDVKGAFYGADAAELAGVFHDKRGVGGAFGAEKQQ